MQNPIETQHTSKDSTSDEIKEIRTHLDEHLQNRKVDGELFTRAWHTAHRIAAMLYDEFSATKVAVFGSLAEQDWFSKWSDIDIAVWGIPKEQYLRASSRSSDISGLFKVDLVDFEGSNGLFQKRMQNQLIPIEKGVNYQVDRSSFFVRISDERSNIKDTIAKIGERLEKIKTAPKEYREEIETTIAKNLVDCYRGIENIFRLIALDVDLLLPDGSRWHKDLLMQMAHAKDDRQPVISPETYELLQELLEFRHVFNNIYEQELRFEKTEKIAKQIGMLYDRISKELDEFLSILKKEEND